MVRLGADPIRIIDLSSETHQQRRSPEFNMISLYLLGDPNTEQVGTQDLTFD